MKLLFLSLLAAVGLGFEMADMIEMGQMFMAFNAEKAEEMGFTEADAENIATCIESVAEKATSMDMEFLTPLMAAIEPFDVDKLITAIGDLCEGDSLKRLLLSLWGAMNKANAVAQYAALETKMSEMEASVTAAFKAASATSFAKFFTEDAGGELAADWTTRAATADDVVANDQLVEGEDAYFHTTQAATGQKSKPVATTANQGAFATLAGKVETNADGTAKAAAEQTDPEVKDLVDNGILDDSDLQDLVDAADFEQMGSDQEAAADVELKAEEAAASPAFLAGAGVIALLSLLL